MKVIISLVDQRHQINVYTPYLAGETISEKTNRTVAQSRRPYIPSEREGTKNIS